MIVRSRDQTSSSSKSWISHPVWPRVLVLGAALALALTALSADEKGPRTQNVFLISADGLRWQEVFQGAEELLLSATEGGVKSPEALRAEFWRDTPEARREALMPFLWKTIAKKGQVWGNRALESDVHVANATNVSYPGYNEFITGVVDPRIFRNDRDLLNPNVSVFEWLNRMPAWKGKVYALSSWSLFPYIINAPRSQIPIWTGTPLPAGSKAVDFPPDFQALVERSYTIWNYRPDKPDILGAFLAYVARDVVIRFKPRVLWVAYGDTDSWAHEGRYDRVLWSIREYDRLVSDLWNLVQSMPEYKDKTTFILTPDHGRGIGPVEWKSHGKKYAHSEETWFAVIGPDTPPLGERSQTPVVTQSQIAATLAAFLGEDYLKSVPAAAPPVAEVIQPGK